MDQAIDREIAMLTLKLYQAPESTGHPLLDLFQRRLINLLQRGKKPELPVDPDTLPADRQRDLGFIDGRGPSLRRPERV